jgi:hypothetical protein
MNRHLCTALRFLSLLALTYLADAQSTEPFQKKTFHVVEVRQSEDRQSENECGGMCSVTKIEVSGFTCNLCLDKEHRQTILYSLECTEFTYMPPSKSTPLRCIHVQAGENYPARIYPTAVMFGEEQHVEGVSIVLYNIVSQRESNTNKTQ